MQLLIAAQGDDVEAAAALLSRLFLSLPPTSTPQRVPSMKSALHRWWSRLLAPSRGPSTQDVRAHGAPAALADLLSRAKLPDASARPPASELRRAFATAAQLDCECAVHGDVIPAGCPSVCCTGSPAHRVCSACLAAYVASQCDRLADAFAVHQGSFPCREMGMECDGVLPRAEVVRAFSGEPAELFLRGMLAGGAARGAREAESRRKEQAEDGGAREERVRRHVNEIAELQADACPRCRVRFIDKEPGQCMVLKCGNPQCRVGAVSTMFCAW